MDKGEKKAIDYTSHWDTKYKNSEESKLGWYETDLSPMLRLIDLTGIEKDNKLLLVGAGSTRLIDELLRQKYSNIIASDLSSAALNEVKSRVVNEENVEFIVDDLTAIQKLNNIDKVDLWIDRAVLHFFHKEEEIQSYFDLLNAKVKVGGYVILAEFNSKGSNVCSGLPVLRYDIQLLKKRLGPNYTLIENFDYIYLNPGGAERPYIYSLFKRIS